MFRNMNLFVIASALATSAAVVPSQAQAATPVKGIYDEGYLVTSASTTNGGSCFSAAAGTFGSGAFTYPGPARTGAAFRASALGGAEPQILMISFPITPAANVGTWSGSFTAAFLPGGGTPVSGTFTADLQGIDTSSFVGTFTYTYPVSADSNCVTTWQQTFIRSGK